MCFYRKVEYYKVICIKSPAILGARLLLLIQVFQLDPIDSDFAAISF